MNCKQGDLAITVAKPHQRSATAKRNSGRLVEVLRYIGQHEYGDQQTDPNVWECKLLGEPLRDTFGQQWGGTVLIDDGNLRPINDPGTDAKDETLSWLPVPHKEVA